MSYVEVSIRKKKNFTVKPNLLDTLIFQSVVYQKSNAVPDLSTG